MEETPQGSDKQGKVNPVRPLIQILSSINCDGAVRPNQTMRNETNRNTTDGAKINAKVTRYSDVHYCWFLKKIIYFFK